MSCVIPLRIYSPLQSWICFRARKLGIGPALLDDPRYGFFYDVITPQPLTEADLGAIEKRMRHIASRNLPYRRDDEISKAEALRIFEEREEPLKRELIDEKAGESVSVYYIDNSPFIDFCLGPHAPNTNKLRAFKLLSLAGAYWKGDATLPQMQRIYGTAFFTQEQLDAWLKQREEAEKRDHRRSGKELDLFSIQEQYGQGLIFWHPKGGIDPSADGGLPARGVGDGAIIVLFIRHTSPSANCG